MEEESWRRTQEGDVAEDDEEWWLYFGRDNQQNGPLTAEELSRLYDAAAVYDLVDDAREPFVAPQREHAVAHPERRRDRRQHDLGHLAAVWARRERAPPRRRGHGRRAVRVRQARQARGVEAVPAPRERRHAGGGQGVEADAAALHL